jgi:D-amino peptidase
MALMVGQHAMAGTPDGNLNHTQNSRAIEYYQLNGRAIGEIAQFALTCGAVGVPLVFLSGDAAACREAEELIPSVTTAAVKQGIGRGTAISLSGPKARQLIRNRVRTAVESHTRTPIRPLVWEAPYVLDIRFFTTDLADTHPGERIDPRTVRQRAQDILEII